MAWLVFFYLAFQLISIPFAMTYRSSLSVYWTGWHPWFRSWWPPLP